MAADASRRAALLVAYILPVCALLAPGRAGASTPTVDSFIPAWVLIACQGSGPARVTRSRRTPVAAITVDVPRAEMKRARAGSTALLSHEFTGRGTRASPATDVSSETWQKQKVCWIMHKVILKNHLPEQLQNWKHFMKPLLFHIRPLNP